MIMQPIHARSLKFITTLRANEPSQTVCKPSQTLREAEETFFCKVPHLLQLLLIISMMATTHHYHELKT